MRHIWNSITSKLSEKKHWRKCFWHRPQQMGESFKGEILPSRVEEKHLAHIMRSKLFKKCFFFTSIQQHIHSCQTIAITSTNSYPCHDWRKWVIVSVVMHLQDPVIGAKSYKQSSHKVFCWCQLGKGACTIRFKKRLYFLPQLLYLYFFST